MAERDAAEIRAELEQARTRLASSVDQLTDRLAPQRLVEEAKTGLVAKATSPVGMAVIGGAGVLLTLLMIRNLRHSRRD
ncbi:MAG TPA: DUF3618 domain-containing protein [Jatrophihabitans sp.]|nr:DUF3618 domain-containing protein [Jatrophihabitans sp.]